MILHYPVYTFNLRIRNPFQIFTFYEKSPNIKAIQIRILPFYNYPQIDLHLSLFDE